MFHLQLTVHHEGKAEWPGSSTPFMASASVPGFSHMAYSVYFLIEPRITCPGWLHPQWVDPHTPIIHFKKCPTSLSTGQPEGGRDLLNGGSLFPDDSSLCPVDQNLPSTVLQPLSHLIKLSFSYLEVWQGIRRIFNMNGEST